MELTAHNLSFRYRQDSPWILENICFSVKSGERIGLFAPSGYGKSTFSRLLAGYAEPSRGKVLLDGRPLPQKGCCPVQLIYQHPELAVNPRWKLSQVLEEAGGVSQDLLNTFGIQPQWLERRPSQLSGGELQRFCIVRALSAEPEFLICDEISTMLDTITQAQIWNGILKFADQKKMGLVVVTHNMALARRICSRVFDLAGGTFLADTISEEVTP